MNESKIVIDRLAKQLRSAKFDSLREDILLYTKRALKLSERFPEIELNELEEVSGMLSENIDLWEQNLINRTLEQGIEIGTEIGTEKGIEIGTEKGIEIGTEKGIHLVLVKLLLKKYGSISEATKKQLDNASSEELQLWVDKILEELTVKKLTIESV